VAAGAFASRTSSWKVRPDATLLRALSSRAFSVYLRPYIYRPRPTPQPGHHPAKGKAKATRRAATSA
jgi:hypothetical protein